MNKPVHRSSVVQTRDLSLITRLEEQIPEFPKVYPLSKLEARLKGRPYLALLSLHEGEAVGYKVGYEESPTRFYSWIGAVLPGFRGQGRARQLLQAQEAWCQEQGYEQITVWSENRYRSMMIFLLKEGYDVSALSTEGKVQFCKRIQDSLRTDL